MEELKQETAGGTSSTLGMLIAPLAVVLALALDAAVNGTGVTYDLTGLLPFLAVVVGAVLGTLPTVLKEAGTLSFEDDDLVSLVILPLMLLLAALAWLVGEPGAGIVIFVAGFGSRTLIARGRWEASTMLIFGLVALILGVSEGRAFHAGLVGERLLLDTSAPLDPQSSVLIGDFLGSELLAAAFEVGFTVGLMHLLLGLGVAVLGGRFLHPPASTGWFAHFKSDAGRYTLLGVAGIWFLSHALILLAFLTNGDGASDEGSVTRMQLAVPYLDINGTEQRGQHIGIWLGIFTGMAALLAAGFASERWYTRAAAVGIIWVLYVLGVLVEDEYLGIEVLAGDFAGLIWAGIAFLLAVAVWVYIDSDNGSNRWMNRGAGDPGGARSFMAAHGASALTLLAFVMALVIRIQWYLLPSIETSTLDPSVGSWDMTGGSDPWYMVRAVEYVQAQYAHLLYDADRAYPLGGINPRPPLFTWSLAILGMLLEPFLGAEDGMWVAVNLMPAVFGAFMVVPVAMMAKDEIGPAGGVVAAWLIAFMPAHITKSIWSLADHDAFVLLFLMLGFAFWMRAMRHAGSDRLVRSVSLNPRKFSNAVGAVVRERPYAFANAVAAGVAIGITGLAWKGFVYGPSVLFLVYAVQVVFNLFRSRDSTTLSTLFLAMTGTTLIMCVPYYGHPMIGTVFSGAGLLPLLFVIFFAIVAMIITTGYRDKPWTLLIGSGLVFTLVFFPLLWFLEQINFSSAWTTLTSGGGYFVKSKIYATIAEANAPDRGRLFGDFGPFIFLIAVSTALVYFSRALNGRRPVQMAYAIWAITATVMAWRAGRFLYNAAPVMAVLGSVGLVSLWRYSGVDSVLQSMRKSGTRTPADRIKGGVRALWRNPAFSAIGMVLLLIGSQHAVYGLDAALPSSDAEDAMDRDIWELTPSSLRMELLGLSIADSSEYVDGQKLSLGAFGQGFSDPYWYDAYDWLASQDMNDSFADRPAFLSWWDYGFQAMAQGDHPAVADNFQTNIPASGNMLLARGEDHLVAMYIILYAQADAFNARDIDQHPVGDRFYDTLLDSLTEEQAQEFLLLATGRDSSGNRLTSTDIEDRAFKVIRGEFHTDGFNGAILAEGRPLVDGLPGTGDLGYRVWDALEIQACESPDPCDGVDFINQNDAVQEFDRAKSRFIEDDQLTNTTHYVFGEYWYTSDIVEEFDSVSTSVHQNNARIALGTQMLNSALTPEEIHDLHHALSLIRYSVPDYEGLPGSMTDRNHEIDYLAIDHRLYPKGGAQTADSSYNSYNPTGIFRAPTNLSGQDQNTFFDIVIQAEENGFATEMTSSEFSERLRDYQNAAAQGIDATPINYTDTVYTHRPGFFDTVLAQAYVGYGASSLGLASEAGNPAPATGFNYYPDYDVYASTRGMPGTYLENAVPLPGAMMNHFAIANLYEPDDESISGYRFNTHVKILKYYPGATLSGSVCLDAEAGTSTIADGVCDASDEAIPNARILIERDAFSGEGSTDEDSNTYWIPIASVDTDDRGDWSAIVPAGKMRITAYAGESDPTLERTRLTSGTQYTDFLDLNQPRDGDASSPTNPITALLGNVSGMTWIGTTETIVTGAEAEREVQRTAVDDLAIEASGVLGTVTWSGDALFDGDPIPDAEFSLRTIHSNDDNDSIRFTTTNGTEVDGERDFPLGSTGEATFDSTPGVFESDGLATVRSFTGNHTRILSDGQSITANGTWFGTGLIEAVWTDEVDIPTCLDASNVTNRSVPENDTICLIGTDSGTTTYLIDASIEGFGVNASGRYTADTSSRLLQRHEGATLRLNGLFEGTGTFNGTGRFSGDGTFSGPMVEAGAFSVNGLVPGRYNMFAHLENGRTVLLPDPVDVAIEMNTAPIQMELPGAVFRDNLTDFGGSGIADAEILLSDTETDDDPISFRTNETGFFAHGPLTTGTYAYTVDLDGDGFHEVNATLTVEDLSTVVTLAGPVLDHIDLTVTDLRDSAGNVVTDRTVRFEDTDSTNVVLGDVDENGTLFVELPITLSQTWYVSDSIDENEILALEYRTETSDTNLTGWIYAPAVNTSGVVVSPSRAVDVDAGETFDEYLALYQDDLQQLLADDTVPTTAHFERRGGLPLIFRSGGITLETTTASNGTYSIVLPGDRVWNLTSSTISGSTAGYRSGMLVDAASSADSGTLDAGALILEPFYLRGGSLFIGNTSVPWDTNAPGYVADGVTVSATKVNGSVDGVTWTETLDSTGQFTFYLPDGEYRIDVMDPDMDVDANSTVSNGSESQPTVLRATIPDQTVEFRLWLDTNEDRNASNGTLVAHDFDIVPVGSIGTRVNVSADDIVGGLVNVTLEVGIYRIEIDSLDASDPNATEFDIRWLDQVAPELIIGLEPIGETVELAFQPVWRLNGTLLDSNDTDGIDAFELFGDDPTQYQRVAVGANGTFATYVEQGSYTLIVEDRTVENVTETLRQRLIIDRGQTMNLNTIIASEIDLVLEEAVTGTELEGFFLRADSQDELGTITLGPSNETGVLTGHLMPGNWTFSVNSTIGQVKRNVTLPTVLLTANGTYDHSSMPVLVNRTVEIGGDIYWDLDDDNRSDAGEGIPDVLVSITSLNGTFTTNVTTETFNERTGVWRTFVPINQTYNVTIEKVGFETTSYTHDDGEGIVVGLEAVSEDLKVSAGRVSMNGTIQLTGTSANDLADDLVVRLIPSTGYVRASPTVSLEVVDGNLTWSVLEEPGDWILHAHLPDVTTPGHVAMAEISASPSEGANVNLTLEPAATVEISTSWVAFDLTPHHLGAEDALITEAVALTVDVGLGSTWDVTPDPADGSVTLTLPAGTVEVDAEFSTNQSDRVMNYTGGGETSLGFGLTSSLDLVFQKQATHDVRFELIALSGFGSDLANATTTARCTDGEAPKTSCDDDDAHETITAQMRMLYDGNEATDLISLSARVTRDGSIPASDAGLWQVQFDSEALETGLNQTERLFNVTITPANRSEALHFDEGHTIEILARSGGSDAGSTRVVVDITERHGFSIDPVDSVVAVGEVIESGETYDVRFEITNNGNGEADYAVFPSFSHPEDAGWEFAVTREDLSAVSSGTTRIVTFTLRALEGATLPTDASITALVVPEAGENQTASSELRTARVGFRGTVHDLGVIRDDGTDREIEFKVVNTGNTLATDVSFTLRYSNENAVTTYGERFHANSVTLASMVPGEEYDLEFTFNGTVISEYNQELFRLYVDYDDQPGRLAQSCTDVFAQGGACWVLVDGNAGSQSHDLDVDAPSGSGGNGLVLFLIILVIGGLVIYGGVSMASNRSGSRF